VKYFIIHKLMFDTKWGTIKNTIIKGKWWSPLQHEFYEINLSFHYHYIMGCIKGQSLVTFEKDDFKKLKYGHLTISHYCHNQNTLHFFIINDNFYIGN